MSKECHFTVPDRAIEQAAAAVRPDSEEHQDAAFALPPQAARDLGVDAGDVSAAATLLGPPTEPDANALYQQTDRERELKRAARNFSFTGGETLELFNALSRKNQEIVLKLRGRLIRKFSDRGLSERSIGLLAVNMLDDGLQGSGTMSFPGSGREHYELMWMAHLGAPLDDRPDEQHQPESTSTYIRYRGKIAVCDLAGTMASDWLRLPQAMGGTWFEWADTVPRIGEDQWAPTIRLDGELQP